MKYTYNWTIIFYKQPSPTEPSDFVQSVADINHQSEELRRLKN
jgi:hypothetical protein